jgi:predicted GIY-YIG superfamily endonuclease
MEGASMRKIIMTPREEAIRIAHQQVGNWVVYVLSSQLSPMRTYCGVTNNWPRRFRQHNGEIRGGARATQSNRPWKLAALMYGFGKGPEAKSAAMRAEWFGKVGHYRRKIPEPWCLTGPTRRTFLMEYSRFKVLDRMPELKLCYCDPNMLFEEPTLLEREKKKTLQAEEETKRHTVMNVIVSSDENHV